MKKLTAKISTSNETFNNRFLRKISIFDKKLRFLQNIRFLTKISILEQLYFKSLTKN